MRRNISGIGITVAAAALLVLVGMALGRRASEPVGLFASASCEASGAILSTGSFNSDTEVLYYLDSQAGQLTAGLLSRSEPGFLKTYRRNVKADLQKSVESLQNVSMPQNPTFIMVTGDGDLRKIGAGEMNNLAKALVYIAEVNTGVVLVYALPLEGDRDIGIAWGDIPLFASARLNSGSPAAPAAEPTAGAYQRKRPENVGAGYFSTK